MSELQIDMVTTACIKTNSSQSRLLIYLLLPLLPLFHSFQSLSTWVWAHLTAARAACGPPGKPLSFIVSAISMNGTTMSVPGPPYSACKKSLRICFKVSFEQTYFNTLSRSCNSFKQETNNTNLKSCNKQKHLGQGYLGEKAAYKIIPTISENGKSCATLWFTTSAIVLKGRFNSRVQKSRG